MSTAIQNKEGTKYVDVITNDDNINRLAVEMASDIQIGAVEIKNYNSDTRVEVNPNRALRVFSDEFIDNDTTITRNADGSIATVITTNGSLTKTETIVRNVDGSISQVNITVV